MDNPFDKKYPLTPKGIVDDNNKEKFYIPIYQRLFVWEEKEINQLLSDLWKSFLKSQAKQPSMDAFYYIGIITVVKKENGLVIIDGQQRLTFLSLFAAFCLKEEIKSEWKQFLYTDTESCDLRIKYVGRPDDRKDIQSIADGKTEKVQNSNFKRFLECMELFFNEEEKRKKKSDFLNYVFAKTSFLVAELPANYETKELNHFFEIMNSSGKQLTPVEQIKGKYFAENASKFDKCLTFDSFDSEKGNTNTKQEISITEILDSTIIVNPEPPENRKEAETRLILDPEIFLLHSLDIACRLQKKTGDELIDIPHSKQHLLEAFEKYFEYYNDKSGLLDVMQNYRAWLDKNIIYLEYNVDTGSYDYHFRFEEETRESSIKDCTKEEIERLKEMKQFQSMLYVSSSTDWQDWVLDAYLSSITEDDFILDLDYLKRKDVESHKCVPRIEELTYPAINRYWFWLLDYILWEKSLKEPKDDLFKSVFDLKQGDWIKIIQNYKFQQNRSREHLHPQTDGLDDNHPWNIEKRIDIDGATSSIIPKHWFGNLALISIPSNSGQSNEPVNVKFARIQNQLKDKSKLESIKMLLMFSIVKGDHDTWDNDPDISIAHGKQMYSLLTEYYKSNLAAQ